MSIDPTNAGAGQPLGGSRLDPAGGHPSARTSGPLRALPEGARPGDVRDQVRLSEEARAAAGSEALPSPSGLSEARLHEILKRLTSGYYDNPEVQDRIAHRIHEEWAGGDVRVD